MFCPDASLSAPGETGELRYTPVPAKYKESRQSNHPHKKRRQSLSLRESASLFDPSSADEPKWLTENKNKGKTGKKRSPREQTSLKAAPHANTDQHT